MKNLLTISFLALLASCGGKESESQEPVNILENLTYSVDTVVVDAGDDFVNVGFGLGAFDLTPDQNQLMFFERDPLKMVIVDLKQLKVLGKTEFQKEGPNGVGSSVIGFQIGPNGVLAIQSFNSYSKFNMSGELIESLKVVPEEIDSELANDYQKLYNRAVFDSQNNRIYTQPTSEVFKENELFIIDPLSKKVKSFPIPEMKAVNKFSGTYTTKSGESTMSRYFGVSGFMEKENGQLLISAAPTSGFYRLDTQTDSLEFIDIQHKTVLNQWSITVDNTPSDEATFMEDRRKVNEQLNFMAIRWDESREMYLRLGKKTYLGENPGDPSSYEFYLFAYDKDFNVLGETKLGELEPEPRSYFWKDGKLWSYINVEDELGFAVFTFDF